MITLTVRPTGHPGYFAAIPWAGGPVFRASRQPLLDACRALLAAGAAPGTEIALFHDGSPTECIRTTIGAGTVLTVDEGGFRARFRKYVPRPDLEVEA